MADAKPTAASTLTATYTSPANEPFTYVHSLPPLQTTSAKERVAYLAALKKATVEMQERINKELTSRMEEDNKLKEAGANIKGKEVDDKKEEDNYGEEVVEEED